MNWTELLSTKRIPENSAVRSSSFYNHESESKFTIFYAPPLIPPYIASVCSCLSPYVISPHVSPSHLPLTSLSPPSHLPLTSLSTSPFLALLLILSFLPSLPPLSLPPSLSSSLSPPPPLPLSLTPSLSPPLSHLLSLTSSLSAPLSQPLSFSPPLSLISIWQRCIWKWLNDDPSGPRWL